MSKSTLQPLSAAQLEIMEIIWKRSELAVSEVWQILRERREVSRNTVQTTLVRIEEKGWLKHRVIGRTFFYSPTQPREVTRGLAVRKLLTSIFRGRPEELMTTLLENTSLTKAEADRIRQMIDQAEHRRCEKGK